MAFKLVGIQYRHPLLYRALIPLIHRRSVIREFKKQVGKNVSVFDIAAGFGGMSKNIDQTNTYSGIDLNKTFVEYGRKKGKNIKFKSIFDPEAYSPNDVLILVDVIHHIPAAKLQQLFDLVFRHANKRVVILEPAFLNLQEKYGAAGTMIDWLMKKFDSDGVNEIQNWMNQEEYSQLFENRFGSVEGKDFTVNIQTIYPYYLVTYTKK
jgi:cyclopropane fatty-acyl-phospholipid synthase-like methyltransferase